MPVYEYICKDCNQSFEKILTLTEHDQQQISCPHCRSRKQLRSER
jgi:putative FmdB family regulatory protein